MCVKGSFLSDRAVFTHDTSVVVLIVLYIVSLQRHLYLTKCYILI